MASSREQDLDRDGDEAAAAALLQLKFVDQGTAIEEAKDEGPPIKERVQKCMRNFWTMRTLKRYVPIINWIPQYNLHKLQSDAIAGISVGLTVIPQGMAYASVAGLPLQYGLYSAFMACFVYCIFGGTAEVTIGPTAIMGLLTNEHSTNGGPPYAVVLCFLTGVIEFLFGVLNLGFLIDFISSPVISGFSSAAAIIIGATQIKGLLGLKFHADHFVEVVHNVFLHIADTNYWDLILGLICMAVLLTLRKLSSIRWEKEATSLLQKVFRKFVWLVCTGRNAIVVMLSGLLAFTLVCFDHNVFTLTGDVQGGLPDFKLPEFTQYRDNRTIHFGEIVSDLGSSLGLIPLLAVLEHIAIAKVFAQGKTLDASQEIIALGLSNVMGSFVSSFPATGSFSRTALNASSGVKTAFGGIFTGALVLLALGVLTTSFKFIPKPTLSAVIISTVIFMIEYEMVPHLWKSKKTDFVILMATFFSCIFVGAEYGIIIGIGISLLVLLYNTARPTITMEKASFPDMEYIIVQPDRTLYYPAMEYLKYRVNKLSKTETSVPVVFDGAHLTGTDYTIAQGIKQLTAEFKSRNQKLVFTNLKPEVVDIINTLKPEDFQHCKSKEEIEAILKAKFPEATPAILNGSIQSLARKASMSIAEIGEYPLDRHGSARQSLAHLAQILCPEEYNKPVMVSKEVQVKMDEEEAAAESVGDVHL